MTRAYCALVHHPVRDRAGETVTTAVTTLDVHDIARSARTYGLRGYFVVTPIAAQHQLVEGILEHWREGAGRRRTPERHDALSIVSPVESVAAAVADIERREGARPRLIATAAASRAGVTPEPFARVRQLVQSQTSSNLILFGTGHGLADSLVIQADTLLEPIAGCDGYNHLSVRSAAAIVLDRLFGSAADGLGSRGN